MDTFEAWMKKVDLHIASLCGLGHRDIADQTWYDWFNDEMSPEEAAELALEDEGFPFEE